MADAKPLASLSSGLLARKGQAKPAMRRQGFDAMVGSGPAALDDLGWNDMGDEPASSPAREQFEQLREQVEEPRNRVDPASLLSPEPRRPEPEPVPEPDSAPEPAALEAAVPQPAAPEASAAPETAPARTVPPIAMRRARREARSRTGRTATGKAAFTLRLDAERHLKLRLAAALERESAQALVTRALDRFLDDLDGLDRVLGQLPQKG